MIIAAIFQAAISLVPGQHLEAVISASTPSDGLANCMAQTAAAHGMSSETYVGEDGSWLMYCSVPAPKLATVMVIDHEKLRTFMVCRSRWNIESKDQQAFCRAIRADSPEATR